ncbi:type VI secretion system Vgr family protein [Burkholderia sp. Ax-1719]|uniref:type VI secretion system Vgr family protein n=1 Tax=Burkholderia sp. Ax-1719 TaxID=2608334 RepID=UPI001421B2A5|nr:type VI secretion system Vgr family protein [Burkholderia sp. Ax-1719]NIE65904.1 type VI secretion system tip protein VgrG [Burkholderia sp. Ax-1719]
MVIGVQDLFSLVSSGISQQDRLLKLDTPLGPNVLLPQRAIGHSRIGRNYEFTVDVLSLKDTLELKTLIAQPVTLWIQQNDKSYHPHHGYIHTVRRLGSDGQATCFQLTFSSWLHFLKFRKDARIFQELSTEDILTAIFNEHPQARGAYRIAVRRPTPVRSFCIQYEDDWNFVHRLMEAEGLFGYFEQSLDGKSHTYVVTDDVYALAPMSPKVIDFARIGVNSETDAFLQWTGTRTLQSATYTTSTFDYKNPLAQKGTSFPTIGNQGSLPEQAEVYEYTGAYSYLESDRGDQLTKLHLEEWESRAKRFVGVGGVRRVDVGQYFTLAGHPEHDHDASQDREFVVIAADWYIENNLPAGNTHPFPQGLQRRIAGVRADYEAINSSLTSRASDGSEGFFLVEAEVQRRSVQYRSPFEHRKPQMQIQTATVVGPPNEEVYTDSLNRIKVHMHWDRRNRGDANSSCWVRVLFSDSGSGYGGVHVPRVGEEVVIAWLDGDCDRPLVAGRLYNGATNPHWHSNGLLSGYKSKEYGGTGYNQLVMDDSSGQSRVQLYTTSANAALHLGYLVDHTGNLRGDYLGSGFDLTADSFGAVRAAQGLFVSTNSRTGLATQPLDAREANQQLLGSESVMDALSEVSGQHRAESLLEGKNALKNFTAATEHDLDGIGTSGQTDGGGIGSAKGFKDPVMLFSSPAGIALSSEKSVHLSPDEQLNLVSGQSTHIATGKSFIASVKEKLSLFAQNAGMKLFAAKGKLELQSHSDNIELTAQQTVKILSTTAKVEVASAKEILLTSGGAYLRITNGNIEIHAPNSVSVKGADKVFAGPASTSYPLPDLPTSSPVPFSQKLVFRSSEDGAAASDVKYALYPHQDEPDGNAQKVISGTSASDGSARHLNPEETEHLTALFGQGEWETAWNLNIDRDDDVPPASVVHDEASELV